MRHDWVYKRLKEVCDKSSSNLQQNKLVGLGGDYPVFGASGYVQNIDSFHQAKPYIGIVKDGSGVGRVNIYPAKSSLLGTMQYLLPKEGVEIGYIAYCLKNLKLVKFVTGAAIPHIYFRDYGESLIPIPPKEIQLKIVSELDKISEVIEKKKAQVKELNYLVQAIFYEMFGDINKNKYEISSLSDVCELITDGTHQTPQYTEDKTNGYMFLSAKDVVAGVIDWSHIKYIPESLHKVLYTRLAPRRNDILLCKNGTTGIAAIVDSDAVFDIYVSLALLRLKEGYIPKYILYAINNHATKQQFDESLKGVGVPNLHLSEIRKTRIITPPVQLQLKFAQKVESIERQKELIAQSIIETQTLFDSRMDYWFNE